MKNPSDIFSFSISYLGKRKSVSKEFKKHFFIGFSYDEVCGCDWNIETDTQIPDWELASNVLHSEVELALAYLESRKSDVFVVTLYEHGKVLTSFKYFPCEELDDWNHEQIAA